MRGWARLFMATAIAAALAGCAGDRPTVRSATHAAVAQGVPPLDLLASTMHGDIVDVMVPLFPPAHTRLALQRPVHDALSQQLVASLQERGYAVEEPETDRRGKVTQPASGLPFDVAFHPIQGDPNYYQVSVLVGPNRLTRAYVRNAEGTAVVAGGDWARRE